MIAQGGEDTQPVAVGDEEAALADRPSTYRPLLLGAILYVTAFFALDVADSIVGAPYSIRDIAQSSYIDTASHIANSLQPLLLEDTAQPRIEQELQRFHSLNPGVVPYLLANDGRVLAGPAGMALARNRVRTAPLRELRRRPVMRLLPLQSDDPAAPDRQTVFSVAPVRVGKDNGWIYATVRDALGGRPALPQIGPFFLLSLLPNIPALLLLVMLVIWVFGRYLFGNLRGLAVSALSLSEGDHSARMQVATRDELGFIAGAFNTMADTIVSKERELIDLERRRRYFVTTILHDIRAPATALKGFVELLHDRATELTQEEKQQLVARIVRSTERQEQLLEKLRELSSYEFHRESLAREQLRLDQIAADAVGQFQYLAAGEQLELLTDTHPCPVVGDRAAIFRALANLIGNAITYTPFGGRITVTVRRTGTGGLCRVRDTGVGIPSEALPHVFDPFYRVDRSDAEKPGTGLGLAIVQSIVTAHGGELQVESVEGEGTELTFSLPDAGAGPTESILEVLPRPEPTVAVHRPLGFRLWPPAAMAIGAFAVAYLYAAASPWYACAFVVLYALVISLGCSEKLTPSAALFVSSLQGLCFALPLLPVFMSEKPKGIVLSMAFLTALATTKGLSTASRKLGLACALPFFLLVALCSLGSSVGEQALLGLFFGISPYVIMRIEFAARAPRPAHRRISILLNAAVFWIACISVYSHGLILSIFQSVEDTTERRTTAERIGSTLLPLVHASTSPEATRQFMDIVELNPKSDVAVAIEPVRFAIGLGVGLDAVRSGLRVEETMRTSCEPRFYPALTRWLGVDGQISRCVVRQLTENPFPKLYLIENDNYHAGWKRTVEVHSFGGMIVASYKTLLMGILFSLIAYRLVGRHLQAIKSTIERVSSGSFDARAPVAGGYELAAVSVALNRMLDSLTARIEERREEDDRRRFLIEALVQTLDAPSAQITAAVKDCAAAVAQDRGGELKDALVRVEHQLKRLSHVAEDIFQLSQLEVAEIRPQQYPCEVEDLLDAAVAGGAALRQAPTGLPLIVGDVALLTRAMRLLGEAVAAARGAAIVSASSTGREVTITIGDLPPSSGPALSEPVPARSLDRLLPEANPFRVSVAERILVLHAIPLYAEKDDAGKLRRLTMVTKTAAAP